MPRGSLTDAIRAMLSDGTWHDTDEVVVQCDYLIPPTKAAIHWKQVRKTTTSTLCIARLVSEGRRAIILKQLKQLDILGHIQRREQNGRLSWTLAPGIPVSWKAIIALRGRAWRSAHGTSAP